jgi:glycosyltransferase involved in cell wall biosynthesis
MTADRPTLSICIPTRNRERHLATCLGRIFHDARFPFPIEVVLSDNASTDGTETLAGDFAGRGHRLRYFRQDRDVGAHANVFLALRRARGRFALYLGDDDGLDIANLCEAVAWMSATPGCVASYGPIANYDGVENVTRSSSYLISGQQVFDSGDRCRLARFIAEHLIIPEVAVFRTSVLGDALLPTPLFYWAFQVLDRLLGMGSVCFRDKAHYRANIRQWVGDEFRRTETTHLSFERWESMYRGAYNFYHAALIADGDSLSQEERLGLEREFGKFGDYLMNSPIYSVSQAGRFFEAVDIVRWLAGTGHLAVGTGVLQDLMANSTAGALFALVELLEGDGELETLVLYRFADHAAAIAGAFQRLRPELEVRVIDDVADGDQAANALVLTLDQTARDALIDRGCVPGQIICLPRLLGSFDIQRWLAYAARTHLPT